MSGQENRQGVSPWKLWAFTILGVFLAIQVVYQLVFPGRTFTDPEEMKSLEGQALDKSRGGSNRDWPQWRGPHRDGVSEETDLLTAWPESGPKKLWERPVGAGYSALAIARGRAITLMQQGNEEAVVCWDALTGKERWRFHYPASYHNDYGDGPRSTPTINGDHVYTVGGTGMLHCLKIQPASPEGEMVWYKDLLVEFGAQNLKWGVSFSPLVSGNLVFTNPGGPDGNSLAAFDKITGELRWKNLDDPAGYSSPIAVTLAGQPQVVFFTGAGLVGVQPDNGRLLWRFPWETSYGCNIATPLAVKDYVFISSGYQRGCAVVHVMARPDQTMEARPVYENKNMRNHFSSSVFHEGFVYGFNEAVLTCLDFRTGKVKWKQGGFDKGTLLIAGRHLLILGEHGKLALADASPEGYRELASCQVSEEKCWTAPALANGLLYIRDGKRVMCLDLRKK